MTKKLITNALLINEGARKEVDVLINNGRIEKIGNQLSDPTADVLDLEGNILIPGAIDDQVHFREPGLTHKANIYTEAKAAVAGGVTSYMEMPNTKPTATTQERLEEKYQIAAGCSLANYSFFMGATNDNLEEILKTNRENVCGVKIFMGSSTGNMLVDNTETLEGVFSKCPMLIALHCEDEDTIKRNTQLAIEKYGEDIPFTEHPEIRSREACYLSSSRAIDLAKKHGTRIHVLHISTAEELDLFDNSIPLIEKKITSEVCVHHLSFTSEDYLSLGSKVKCNPAIKYLHDREALWEALNDNRLDVVATDHAPHTEDEKAHKYLTAPSGLPLVQHSLHLMMMHVRDGRITMERMIEKMCHAPADLFSIRDRGYVREGYWADLVVVNPDKTTLVNRDNILYKCGWSPLEGTNFQQIIEHTFVSGHHVYNDGVFDESKFGERLLFDPRS